MIQVALSVRVRVKREQVCREVGEGSYGHFRERKKRERVHLVTVKNGGSSVGVR